jgi:uncharacterized linocin/CFP29 family protein
MTDLLRRDLAPVTPEAWRAIDGAATGVLKALLSARGVVDFDGPHGLEFAAVNLGRLDIPKKQGPGGVPWGLRMVQPLVEVRIPFALDQMELDGISRGCKDADFKPLEEAARKLALFEETAIYKGFAAGQITGILPTAGRQAIDLPAGPEGFPQAVGKASRP